MFRYRPPKLLRRFRFASRSGTSLLALLTALLAGPALADPDPCTITDTTALCEGDQSDGIQPGDDFSTPPVDTLIVRDLDRNVDFTLPDGDLGAPRLRFHRHSWTGVTLDIDAGLFEIIARRPEVSGIGASTNGRDNASIVATTRAIIPAIGAGPEGILLALPDASGGSITLDHAGDILVESTASGAGIRMLNSGATAPTGGTGPAGINVTLASNMVITGTSARGIEVTSDAGPIAVRNTGNITVQWAQGEGILAGALGGLGAVTVENTGIILSGRTGIQAVGGTGDVAVTQTGDITAGTDGLGIQAVNLSTGDVAVTLTGDIAAQGRGIEATSNDGAGIVTSTGDITSATTGGVILSAGTIATITSIGDMTVTGLGAGLQATSVSGPVTISSTGDIAATLRGGGIRGISTDGAVSITSVGNITAGGDRLHAIHGLSGTGTVTLSSEGALRSTGQDASAILGRTTSGNGVTITNDGAIKVTGIANSAGILGISDADGAVRITSTDDISTTGSGNASTVLGATPAGIRASLGAGVLGSSSQIRIDHTGNISTTGDFADGIYTTLLGAGSTNITSQGDIATTGEGATGILAIGGTLLHKSREGFIS